MILLHEHYFGLASQAEYFINNDSIYQLNEHKNLIGLAFYRFDYDYLTHIINLARGWTDRLIVYIAEPFDQQLIKLLQMFESDPKIQFFGDGVLNVPCTNWHPAICWFVTPRHYYQVDAWAQEWLAQVDHSLQHKPFHFDCLLGIPRSNRDAVERAYLASSVQDKIIYSYHKDNIKDGIWDWDIGTATGSWQSVKVDGQHEVALSALVPHGIYNQSWHSIVAESTDYNEISHMTEKVAKPIMSQRIFIAFAGQYYLKNLQGLGFRTFDTIIDEGYDLESEPDRRYQQAWQQVEWLCNQDPLAVRQSVSSVLEHNRDLFLSTDWQAELKQHLSQ